ncbi:hypothetical protein Dimus_006762 [Dionaea muscipula]
MEKPTSSGGGEIQCVGRLEIVRPIPVGLLCIGSLPVPTDQSIRDFNSALVPSSQTVTAPRYRMLPMETDLNMPPMVSSFPERVLPIGYGAAVQSTESNGDVLRDSSAISSNLARRGEALAVSGLVEYGDDIDVIAPADILKQIFKMPYSKARLSIAVHRIGHTLVLNAGPGIEEGERLVRRNHPKCADHALFINFAMHSVRMEACDCPPNHSATDGQAKSAVLPDFPKFRKSFFTSSEIQRTMDVADNDGCEQSMDNSELKQESFYWESTNTKCKGRGPAKRTSQVGGKLRCSMQESEKYRHGGSDEFLRVLFWQFHNFRMLLGSDLLLFSNEKYLAVSLHLWDVSRPVTPLTWLDAWLDNVMASVPELAICYHQNGVVQGYELLKTDDIFLMKGISEDGTLAFHPHVVQQNGLSVLRFLQENCKRDPGAYWLHKSAGEDAIQLFDLSVIPQNRQSDNYDECASSLPSFISRGRIDALSSLGTLLYRIAHRLSLSMAPNSRARCSGFFRKCFELLDESDDLVIRAMAHEQFARLILNNGEELDLTVEASFMISKVTVADAEDDSLDIVSSISDSNAHGLHSIINENQGEDLKEKQDMESRSFKECELAMGLSISNTVVAASASDEFSPGVAPLSQDDETFALSSVPPASVPLIQTIANPVSSKLAAVHHISQAIKSLRWVRQLQETDPLIDDGDDGDVSGRFSNPAMIFSLCACGDTDCIEVCDIKQWLPTLKLDHKLWKLVLLLGESYLALGEAHKEDGQLFQALKVVEIACSIYGSMPQHLENTKFISSMVSSPVGWTRPNDRHEKKQSMVDDEIRMQDDSCHHESSSTYLFWSKAWTLVGDVYVEFYKRQGMGITKLNQKPYGRELGMPSEVVEELMRLKKKLGKDKESCNTCSLVNCSCQSDRVSSGNSASSSSADNHWFRPSRRQGRRSHAKSATDSPSQSILNHHPCRLDLGTGSESGSVMSDRDCETLIEASNTISNHPKESSSSSDSIALGKANDGSQTGGVGFALDVVSEATTQKAPKTSGGIFKYLYGPSTADVDNILSDSLHCYEHARKAFGEILMGSKDLEAVTKKIGWVCNELGRNKLEKKNLAEAELAFADAINAFKEISDSTNVVLINCNLGHGRRALAEEVVSKMEYLKNDNVLHNAYKQALETAKMDYARSLGFYQAAKSELAAVGDDGVDVSSVLRNEVYTQLAHTYLRLGMLLAKEGTVAEIYENGASENRKIGFHGSIDRRMKRVRKHEISANDAILKALSLYESLGELRKQEAAYAYFQLACHQKDCCLRIIDSDNRGSNLSGNENSSFHRSKVLAERCWQKAIEPKLLAERYWQKAVEFYNADTHPAMYLAILLERSTLLLHLSSCLHSNTVLESALICLLDGRFVSSYSASIQNNSPEIHAKFWSQLQKVLLKMAQSSSSSSKPGSASQSNSSSSKRFAGVDKVKELYKMSLRSTDFNQLHAMHNLWTSPPQQ